jgi:hypothetical protein
MPDNSLDFDDLRRQFQAANRRNRILRGVVLVSLIVLGANVFVTLKQRQQIRALSEGNIEVVTVTAERFRLVDSNGERGVWGLDSTTPTQATLKMYTAARDGAEVIVYADKLRAGVAASAFGHGHQVNMAVRDEFDSQNPQASIGVMNGFLGTDIVLNGGHAASPGQGSNPDIKIRRGTVLWKAP